MHGSNEMYVGPVMDETEGFLRHCYTVLRNSKCPYLKFGCLGCTPRWAVFNLTDWAEAIRKWKGGPR